MKAGVKNGWALTWKQMALRLDARALIALVSIFGTAAWLGPWPVLFFFLPVAALSAGAAYALMPGGRGLFKTYMGFVFFWALSFFFLQVWEHWGESKVVIPASQGALLFGARLFTVLGLASLLPLCASAVTVGRALTWYIQRFGLILRGGARARVMDVAWKAGLALAVMASFMPRAFRALKGLSQNLKLRAPHLTLHRRLWLLGLSALRLTGSQTWDMAVCLAARGLYREEPWRWREPTTFY